MVMSTDPFPKFVMLASRTISTQYGYPDNIYNIKVLYILVLLLMSIPRNSLGLRRVDLTCWVGIDFGFRIRYDARNPPVRLEVSLG